jgi:EmrB/QacA subfamily drug resistance transporter
VWLPAGIGRTVVTADGCAAAAMRKESQMTVTSQQERAASPAGPGRIGRRQRLILAVLLTASFTLAVDFSILNVALPRIGADTGFSLGSLQWIATSFALSAAGFTLFFGRLADLAGRRRMFLAGMAVLGIASLAGGLAGTPWVLLAARVAQGLATAAVTPAALSLLTTSFPEGPVRDRALGLNGALMAAGFTAGAILGGVLTDLASWRWAFFINVAIAAAVLAVSPVVLAESRPARRPRLDLPGAVLVTLGLLAVVFGLTEAGQRSWSSPLCYGALLAGAAALAGFWAVERTAAQPLVPLPVLRRRTVAWGNCAGLVAFASETSVVFLLTLYLQQVRGYSPLQAGLSFAVLGAGTVLGGLLGPRLIGAIGSRNAVVLGLSAQAVTTVPLIFLGPQAGWIVVLLAATFAGGVANLLAIVGFLVTATSGLPDAEQGLATGLTTMSQQVGITMGIPVMSAIATARVHGLGAPTAGHVLAGISTALAVNAAVAAATAIVLAATRGRARTRS